MNIFQVDNRKGALCLSQGRRTGYPVCHRASSFFIRNKDIHSHNTRTADHFHIPIVKTDLGKTGIKYRGAVIWNIVIKDGINIDVSEAVFKKFLRKLVNDGIIP